MTAAPAAAHEWEEIRLVLLTWANAIASGDAGAAAPLLHPEFRDPFGNDRDVYLRNLGGPGALVTTEVSLEHADHTETDDGAIVEPVLVYTDEMRVAAPLAIRFVRVDDGWQIAGIGLSGRAPPEVFSEVLPEHVDLHEVRVRLRDGDSGEPVGARVHVRDAAGIYWPPAGHMRHIATGWRRDVGGDVRVGERTYAYVEPEFVVPVPGGEYTIEVVRGLEYEPLEQRFEVGADAVVELDLELRRWSNVRADGWFSGDTHVHFVDPYEALLELEGEDLNVVNVLAAKWGQLVTNVEHFTGAPSVLSRAERVVYVGQEARHDWLGHTVLLNLKRLIYPLSWGDFGQGVGVPGGLDYPPMAHHADAAHEQGGMVSWAHFPAPFGELAVDVALDKIDAVDLVTWGDAFAEGGAAGVWYAFLNCGFRLPALGGTDKMLNTQVVGSARTYVQVDGPFSYEAWIDGIRAGRTFATTGPMIFLSVDGRGPGEVIAAAEGSTVRVRAEARSRIPVERLEIVMGGRVVATRENPGRARDLLLEVDLDVDASSWVAARAYSPDLLPVQRWSFLGMDGIPLLGHTSPVYVDVGGVPPRSPRDAAFLVSWADRAIDWARSEARFATEAQRTEVVALFERARAVYAAQIEGR